jgi:hypothetical protein
MNHAVFWVTINGAVNLVRRKRRFLQLNTIHIARSHLSKLIGESSKIVPVFNVN